MSEKPIDMGRKAFKDGEPRSSNPYNRGTKEWVNFVRGWNLQRIGK